MMAANVSSAQLCVWLYLDTLWINTFVWTDNDDECARTWYARVRLNGNQQVCASYRFGDLSHSLECVYASVCVYHMENYYQYQDPLVTHAHISFVYSVEIHTTTPSFVMTFWNSLAMTFARANIFFNTLHYRCWLPYDSFIICLLYSFNLVLRCRWKICPYMNDIMRFITNAQCSYTQSMSSMLHSNCCCAIILKMFQQFVCLRIYRVTVCMMPELKTTLISDVGISYVCSNYSNFNCWK